MTGDFGTSALSGETVTSELGELMVTAPLVLASTILSVIVAVPLGVVAGARHRKPDGVALSAVSQLGIALPSFWVGLMLITLFAVQRQIFPAQGFPRSGWDDPVEAARALVLPTLTLALAQSAILFRFVRSATLDVLHQEYIRGAGEGLDEDAGTVAPRAAQRLLADRVDPRRAGGQPHRRGRGDRRVFTLPGVGQMLVRVGSRDLEKVQGTIVLIAVVVLVIGFLVDVAPAALDPRLRVQP